MSNLQMILTDGTALALDAFGLPMHAVLTCADEDDVLAKWKLLTAQNLNRVEVQQDGETVFAFAGGKLEGTQTVANGDGTICTHFYMQGVRQEVTSETTQDYITAARVLLGEEE